MILAAFCVRKREFNHQYSFPSCTIESITYHIDRKNHARTAVEYPWRARESRGFAVVIIILA